MGIGPIVMRRAGWCGEPGVSSKLEKTMKTPRRLKRQTSAQRYESPSETEAAVDRIHAQFERTKRSLSEEKEYNLSPEGVMKSTLQALLDARKAVTKARKELGVAIVALRRRLPGK
jgi:hypothetical protein